MWAFPRGKIILLVLELPGTPQKRKWSANHLRLPVFSPVPSSAWETVVEQTSKSAPKKHLFSGPGFDDV